MLRIVTGALLAGGSLAYTDEGSAISTGGRELLVRRGPKSCGTHLRRCCKGNKCRKGHVCKWGRCFRGRKPPSPNQPTDSLTGKPCALEGQPCCSGAADEPFCSPGLVCDLLEEIITDNTCKPCGAEGQLACRTGGGLQPPSEFFCDDGLVPLESDDNGVVRTICAMDTRPACPGEEGDPCCTFIADTDPCGQFVVCSTRVDGHPDFGKDISEGVCVSCGGDGEPACFVTCFDNVSGPICEPGLSADTSDPPICVEGGTGPTCEDRGSVSCCPGA